MADASGSGGPGALTIGGIAGLAVVLGGVALFQLGVFGTGRPGQVAPDRQIGSRTENDSGAFSGSGDESGQPLQNRAETGSAPAAGDDGAETPDAASGADAAAAQGEDRQTANRPAPEPAPEEAAAADEGADGTALPAPADQPQDSAEATEAGFVLKAPELDLVRVDRDGAAVIAGRSQEGVRVSVLLDGEVLEQLEVPAGGEFVALTTIAPSADARVVTLLAEHGGRQSASGASFILAPVGSAALAHAEGAAEAAGTGAAEGTAPAEDRLAALQAVEGAAEPPAVAGPGTVADGTSAPADEGSELGTAGVEGPDTAEPAPAAPTPAVAEDPAAPQLQGQAVAVLRADQDGIEVVQPALPADPGLSDEVALDAISYNGTGGVELSGRARPQSRVRIYVDNKPVAELDAAEDGRWNGRLENVAPGLYTLRLDEIEPATGAVVSRLETPFKREAPDALPQPGGDPVPDQPAPLVRAVTVQKGDTLWAISQEKYGSGFLYVRVFEANKGAIRDPDLIYPGQVFTIPE
ncbi:LysM peptidoglycan-binding domain-containing protein [Leisingera thetidis]|uniref:LysM peptidoglycan-binding domain-containing protein n=1 Tax=Leisingera thetidis TaxID=2930199 RepID=UPI0021F6DC05|nr:LysM peptidoglycan-binding domain-containing protein [Leisingera thetidis]